MIRKNLINCKLFHEKRSGKTILSGIIQSLHAPSESCPVCGFRGSMRIHAYYKRSLIEFINGHLQINNLLICRLICSRCSHPSTHAVLPDPIIPYCRHSLFFILRVLSEHAIHLRSVEKISEFYGISVRTFYRWQRLFEAHRKEWQGPLMAAQRDLRASLLELVRKDPFCVFASSFIREKGSSLLQSHQDPYSPLKKMASLPVYHITVP